MSGDLGAYASFAHHLADESGAFIRPLFRQKIDVISKSDESPVTEADRGAERVMRALINERFPDHGIVGEEYGAEKADAEWVWHLDPIDGTKSFITGSAQFASLIALCRNGKPVVGIINQPVNDERWVGIEGQQSTFNGDPISTRACASLEDATLYTWGAECLLGENANQMQALVRKAHLSRFSADGYAYGLLSLGFVDVVADEGMQPHDYLALAPVVKGAGGLITDWDGQEIEFGIGEKTLAVGDARLQQPALNILQG